MTRIDFYVIEARGADDHDRMICRVVEKAWKRGHEVYVRCRDTDAARNFDGRLWQFRDVSFVPHALDDADDAATPVSIGTGDGTKRAPDVLVNLADDVPATASSYSRVIETAGYDESSRARARERYRYYQDRGFPLHTHKVGA